MAQAQQPLTSATQPADVYGGDEVSALVLDPGYCHTRGGFAGEDVPKAVVPSFYAHYAAKGPVGGRDLFGDEVLIPRAELEIRNYMNRDSVVEDWDAAIQLWEHVLVRRLQPTRLSSLTRAAGTTSKNVHNNSGSGTDDMDVDLEAGEVQEKPLAENPLLMTEAPWNSGKARERAIEVAMESWGTPAFWLSRTPVLAAFAAGKASALVVDVGGAGTSVTAVHDGMVLRRSIQRSPAGGLYLSGQIREMWKTGIEPAVPIVPGFLVESKTAVDAGAPAQARLRSFPFAIQQSFRAYEEGRLLTEFKESVVEVWRGPGRFGSPGNEDFARSQPGRVFEMPDGSNQMWREQRYRVAEGMWDEQAGYVGAAPEETAAAEDDLSALSASVYGPLTKAQTIPELVRAAVGSVDADLRPLLLGNVVVTGSTSLLTGFNDRLNSELTAIWPGVKIKIHAAGLTSERRFGAWIGGSILASLGTFHQMWISRAEYEENGAAIVEKRCK
ncbi:chromatin remodeling and histone acetyltransferase complexes subunit [Grosmannia clavigera kw1407]|uniref:Chromatin remodeling and histone acetyltransferase complexes subunit n=1 Tax=Grosmannia clavigera (strain kw1407 / UAMH 11150) TaxID=655863 RepID=F0XAH7_GROCL|nr:chromatin remodeling and histone acetyltransferase complexes subunit [Grosmannia clavigera kw1407]EFX05974.1 chromatin remodeling and histone acetyltransferase complexes subunit [Grosmannia clavigera kw1407]